MHNENQVQEPKKRGRHAAGPSDPKPVRAVSKAPDQISRHLPFAVIVLPILALILGVVKSLGDAFEKSCPDAEAGRCAQIPMGESIPMLADFSFTLGIVVALLAIVAAVELLTWKYREKLAYTGLALLAVFTAFIASGAGNLLFDTMVVNRL